jgi:hypothetical protein
MTAAEGFNPSRFITGFQRFAAAADFDTSMSRQKWGMDADFKSPPTAQAAIFQHERSSKS